ncbi:unnamed protein product [Polarella glacialis]|uniref:Uncharacterized protein n=1 Tax=Polarella glacialis TaxID=89957 RepID=A0A813IAU8_POLGL|nr:unnamed protein product [Polarella glacialis]
MVAGVAACLWKALQGPSVSSADGCAPIALAALLGAVGEAAVNAALLGFAEGWTMLLKARPLRWSASRQRWPPKRQEAVRQRRSTFEEAAAEPEEFA